MEQIEKPHQWQVHDWCREMHRKSLIINTGALGARFFGFRLYIRAREDGIIEYMSRGMTTVVLSKRIPPDPESSELLAQYRRATSHQPY